MDFIIRNLLWSQGTSLLLILAALAVVAFFFYKPALLIVGAAFIFCLFLFRNPIRVCEEAFTDASVLICPSDGKVLEVTALDPEKYQGYSTKIAIFLSPLDVHVNWLPVSGTVTDVVYHKGQFVPAFLPKASELNERNDVQITMANGSVIRVRQITGTIARTIVCWVSKGQTVQAGDTFGMMKFGSRIDLFLPKNVQVEIQKDQKVYGGTTVLGRWI